jgi:hypothetical protein
MNPESNTDKCKRVHGTIEDVQAALFRFADDEPGFNALRASGQPDWTATPLPLASFRITKDEAGRTNPIRLGRILLQGLPGDITEITIKRTVEGQLPREVRQVEFCDFYSKFFEYLASQGFVDKDPPPKRPLGFEKP